jgi:aryl-alcohol dehydrogenase-like predicted oxidoreductase
MSQVVLAWMSRRAKPIVGVSSVEQLDSALGSVDLELTEADLAELDAPR